MGYLGRRIGKSQDTATDAGNGAGGGLLDLFSNGYFQRQGNIYNAPGIALQGLTATGGVISDYTDGPAVYRAHIFTSSGTFDVTAPGSFGDTVDYLVVAGGGGGGGGYYGGGGGAGGLRTNLSGHPLATGNPSFSVSTTGGNGSGSYTVTVGGGGAPGAYGPGSPVNDTGNDGAQGVDSYFGPPSAPEGITSKGGGKGMGRSTSIASETDGYSGGSGGGIAYRGPAVGYGYNPSTPGPVLSAASLPSPYPITQGNPGGAAPPASPLKYGSGGGGAGAVGGDGTIAPYGGPGGIGVQVYIAGPPTTTGIGETAQWFAGGGAGGANGPTIRTGGVGGGGNAGNSLVAGDDAESGMSGTGGGGGGGTSSPNPGPGAGGAGGSGIVVVRYQIAELPADQKATGGAISYYGGKTIHTFTSSGTFATEPNWDATDVEYVIVAGGGGGYCNDTGGGGGAGGYRTGTTPIGAHPVSTTVQVGAGGAPSYQISVQASNGGPSYFGTPLTAAGGGGAGGGPSGADGVAGGSGGGAGYLGTGGAGNTPPTSPAQGFAGGNGGTPGASGGGGGGAGGAGGDNRPPYGGGHGGLGRQVPSTFRNPKSAPGPNGGGLGYPGPTASVPANNPGGDTTGLFWVGGGGGGSTDNPSPSSPQQGKGGGDGGPYAGGGNGGHYPEMSGEAGKVNSGGGGGGTDDGDDGSPAIINGMGGSGIVLIAYPS